MSIERETYTVREAAAVLGISRYTLYDMVKAGTFPAIRLGGRVLIARAQIDKVLAEGISA